MRLEMRQGTRRRTLDAGSDTFILPHIGSATVVTRTAMDMQALALTKLESVGNVFILPSSRGNDFPEANFDSCFAAF